MSIHINVTCNRDGYCHNAIGVGFDSLTETFGDLVAGLRELGWHVETDGNSSMARCLCPEHAPVKGDPWAPP